MNTCIICNKGEIIDYKCNYCKAEFCKKCNRVFKSYIGIPKGVVPCVCVIIKRK